VVVPLSADPSRPSSWLADGTMTVLGMALSRPAAGAPVVVPFGETEGGARLAVLATGVGLEYQPVGATDPDLGLLRVTASVPVPGIELFDADRSARAWDAAVALGRWAVAAELAGLGRHVITEAVAYSVERKQYGRQIGTFQALQHRLAGAHASVVGAESVVAEAAAHGSPWVAMVAKALAGRAAEDACRQAQQVYGAIGFTWEHGFHTYLRRALVLDWLLGGWRSLEAQIGAELQATGEVPRIGML
jgi:Acyl-CoA dehydrogenase, C-terminal domain